MTILETGALATKTGTASPTVLAIIGSVLRITCQVGFERLADMLSIYLAHRGQAIRTLSTSSPPSRAEHHYEERQWLRRKRPTAKNMRFLHFYDIRWCQQWRGLRRFLAFLSGEGAGSSKGRDIPTISLRQSHFCSAAELTAPNAAAAVKAGIPALVRKAEIPALANTSPGVWALALKGNESRWRYRLIPIPSQGGEQRAVFFMDQPLVCSAFYLVVVGSFGMLVSLYAGKQPSLWEVLQHLGVTLYALAHYPQIFIDAWRWDGKERRGFGSHGSGAPGTLGTPRPPRGRR